MKIETINTISRNIVFCDKIISCFLLAYGKQASINLTYTVLPIILFDNSRRFLLDISPRTTIDTLCKQTEFFASLQSKYESLVQHTNKTLIYSHNHNAISLKSSVELLRSSSDIDSFSRTNELQDFFTAAKNYGFICKRAENDFEIFKKLGIII
jgi:hypothetical protein